ncbi:zinc finger BED domain-containing protein isoform X4 [Girardinichthys multiradiatus]|uniref:zinc finger BED domain-containing protein isoform X4 n=1 Tax=Girardinichthys multiradiatus TaxID=208333 RepID=UPI001FADA3A6|nr:zinc finger BED domain-containing protein isoform X4 [Girardinichthys multiradiatus]
MGPRKVYRGMEREDEAAASHDHQHMEIDDEQIISVKLVLEDGESHILTTLNETPVISSFPDTPQAEKTTETEGTNADGGTGENMWDSGQKWIPVEVRVEDDNSDVMTPSNEPDTNHVINDDPDLLREGSTQEATHSEEGDNSSERPPTKDRRRSVIWRHFDRLESSEAAQCRICMRKLQCFDSGCTSNLHRHLSKRHPKVFSELGSKQQLSPDSNSRDGTTESQLIKHELPVRPSLPSTRLKASSQSEVEIRVFERELELIEALRRTQREEAQALQQQRELLKKLQTVGAREAAAEREKIESLRKAQQEEAEELSRQREELENGKAELQKKWEKLYHEREEFLLLSTSKEDTCTEVTE